LKFKIKEKILGYSLQVLLVIVAFIIMLEGGLIFLIVSAIFFGAGGIFEAIIMSRFHSRPRQKISKRDKISRKIKNAFLWVHKNIEFIEKYDTTVYDFEKIGILASVSVYAIMLAYITIALILFNKFLYYGFLVYLIPIITNIASFFRHSYTIKSYKQS